MRKIIYHIACSADGFIAHKNGSVEGLLMTGEHAEEFAQSLAKYDTVIMGTNTYAFGFQFGLQAGQPAYEGMRHLIVTQSLDFEESEFVKRISDGFISIIAGEKEQSGRDIWLCGGGHLAGQLLHNNLIDELVLKINPVLFGNGIPLFVGSELTQPCELTHHKIYSNGVVLQHYCL